MKIAATVKAGASVSMRQSGAEGNRNAAEIFSHERDEGSDGDGRT
jgi:hypothetical protein